MERLQPIYYKITSFVDPVVNTISYIRSILQSAWYSLTTILTWLFDLVSQIFSSWIF